MIEKTKILVADDEEIMRDVLSALLTGDNYTVDLAENGGQALAMLRENTYDVMLLDLLMPQMSGMEALALFRDRWPGTPILVISSMDSDRLVQEALEAGASGYITKPFHPVEIASAVERVLAA